jgi:hypothetical protein
MKAAFGKIVLTHKDYIGKTLAGYTPVQRAEGKYDDIMAHAVLIEDTVLGNVKKRVLIISTDFLKLPLLFTEYVKEQIEKKHFIHQNQILIHAIHTHKSMDMCGEFVFGGNYPGVIKGITFGGYSSDDRYKVWVAKRIVKLVGELIVKLQPACMAWTKGDLDEYILINRRHPMRKSKSPLGLWSFKNPETGKIFGMLINFGMHPTTLSNPVKMVSADYPGRIIERIEQLSQGETDAAFFNAASGDLNPITTCGTNFEELEKDQQPIYGQTGDLKETKKLGYYIGEKALELAKSIPDDQYYDRLEFKSYVKVIWIGMNDYKKYWSGTYVSNRLIHLVKRYLLFPIALFIADVKEPNFPGFAVKHRHYFRPSSRINVYTQLQIIKFKAIKTAKGTGKSALSNNDATPVYGEAAKNYKEFSVVAIPGELFEDYAAKIFERTSTGDKDTFIFQNSNDWIAYLFPIKEYITQGGYEPFASYAAMSGPAIMGNYFRFLKEIDSDISGGFN